MILKKKIILGCAAVLSLVSAILCIVIVSGFPEKDVIFDAIPNVKYFTPLALLLMITSLLLVVALVLDIIGITNIVNLKTVYLVAFLMFYVLSEIYLSVLGLTTSSNEVSLDSNLFDLVLLAGFVVSIIFALKGKKWATIVSIVFVVLNLVSNFSLWLDSYSLFAQSNDSVVQTTSYNVNSLYYLSTTVCVLFTISQLLFFVTNLDKKDCKQTNSDNI